MTRILEFSSGHALISAIMICAATFGAAPASAEAPSTGVGEEASDSAGLAGCYDVTGVDSEELSYSGELCITVVGDQLYELIWTQMEEDEGQVVYNGRGVSMGEDLFAVWSEDKSRNDCYLHLFDIDLSNGSLSGLRVDVNGATGTQKAIRKGGSSLDWDTPGQLSGSYALESSGESAGDALTVTHLQVEYEDAYSFQWSGGTDLEGVGVRENDSIVVVAKPVDQMSGTCGLITYTRHPESRSLEGAFYTPGSLRGETPRRRGEETAIRRQ